ncbi:MAG: type II and III secretion system protein family protein [Alphaproteobacteria bacterium]
MARILLFLSLCLAGLALAGTATAESHAKPADMIEITKADLKSGGTARVVNLALGKARLIKLPVSARDALVANPDVADVVVKTPRLIFILGRAVGSTNAFFLDHKGREIARLDVNVTLDDGAVQGAIRDLIPEADINVKAVNDNLFLTGRVRSNEISENARQIAIRFVGAEANVVNLLAVIEDQQVLLQVKVAEVTRSVLKELGINLFDPNTGALSTITSENFTFRTLTSGGLTDTPFLNSVFRYDRGTGDVLTIAINALERNGLIKTLAEPNLTAISGETANFLAGGEFPVPVGQDNGTVTVEFRQFGIGLNFTPVVLNSGRISLRIATEVSAIAQENSIVSAGISIPGLRVRRAETTVELPSGGSLVIAGLLRDEFSSTITGIPGFSDIPIIGSFLRTNSLTRGETELVLAVTAYLVKPVNQNQLKLPTEGLAPPSDYDLYLRGRLHAVYGKAEGEEPDQALAGPIGYIVR